VGANLRRPIAPLPRESPCEALTPGAAEDRDVADTSYRCPTSLPTPPPGALVRAVSRKVVLRRHPAGAPGPAGGDEQVGRPRGLAFNEDKTRVVPLGEGFDFLGFNVRRYGTTPLIKPSKAAVRRIRERLRDELRSRRGSNAQAVIKRLNPIIRGWAAYYRTQVAAETFGKLDH